MEDGETVAVSIDCEELWEERAATATDNKSCRGSDKESEFSDEGNIEGNNPESSAGVCLSQCGSRQLLKSEFGSMKPVDSGIEIKSLGLQNIDDGNRSFDEECGLGEPSHIPVPEESDSKDLCDRSAVFFNVCDDNAVESASLLSQDHQDDLSALNHPLRSLSCIKMNEQDDACSNFDIPEVKISNQRKNGARSECIPLRNIFRPEEGDSDHYWADNIRYKNWLLHLARRRRCEILILVGFLMWFIFFIALAIVLNGNGKLADKLNGNSNSGDDSTNNSSSGRSKDGAKVGTSKTQETQTLHTSMTTLMREATDEHTKSYELGISADTTSTGAPLTVHLETSKGLETGKDLLSTRSTLVDAVHDNAVQGYQIEDDISDVMALPANITKKPIVRSNSMSVMPTKATLSMTAHLSGDTANVSVKNTVEAGPANESSVVPFDVGTNFEAPAENDDASQSYAAISTTPAIIRNLIVTNTSWASNHITHSDSGITDPVTLSNKVNENVRPTVSYFETTQSTRIESDIQVMARLSELSKMTVDDTNTSNYLIGVGRADITGPAADVNMMGYANPNQVSGGIHLRQYSRAFIIEDPKTGIRTVFVNIDACMASTLIKLEVMNALKKEFGDLYRAENLCISGTHTHSGPAGFLQDVLFQITSWGYVEETLTAMVSGIVDSIRVAHDSIQPGYILLNKGELVGSNINRSPTAYENNPVEERAQYKYNVDTEMVMLKFMGQNNNGIGMINWFPVHCTSMNNTNNLISSDNKGYAEILFESFMDPDARPGESNFVAAFAQSNEGDVSPNTRGPHCTDTGSPCDNVHSTCNGKSQYCVSSGPGKDMFESTKIIGRNQFEKSKELYLSATMKLSGPVKFIHEYVNMTNYEVVLQNATKVKTCKPAMGFSFAAGTTDGPGAFDFKQGDKSGNKFWNFITNFLHSPSKEQTECHFPKPILLDTGEMESPYEWQPQIVETQILQIGQFLIVALPGEFSTMAGRRLRNSIIETFKSHQPDTKYEVALAGLANSYSDYIATHEEYLVQRYEGASTIYGPYTSEAHTQQFKRLSRYLALSRNITSEVKPVDIKDRLISFQISVIYDGTPFFKSFGDVSSDVKNSYIAGEEVSVTFIAGNPRNCLKVGVKNMTFLTVEKEMIDGSWKIILTDADWDTKFTWVRTSTIRGLSDAIISWQTHRNTPPGKYRISHHGYSKSLLYGIDSYSGTSSVFTIKSL